MADAHAGAIFDVDGTLLDNNYFHTIAWWRAFRGAGIEIPMAKIHRGIGMGGSEMMAALLGEQRPGLSEAHGREFAHFRDEMVAFEAVPDLLREVKGMGLRVVLGTSATLENLPAMLKAIGAKDAIAEVVSSDDVQQAKPHPDIFTTAIVKADLDPQRTLIVGDTKWDVEAARRAGLGCVTLLTGGWSSAELESAGSVAVYESPADLWRRLEDSPLAALLA